MPPLLKITTVTGSLKRQIVEKSIPENPNALDAILKALPDYKMSMDPAWVPSLQTQTKEKNAKFAQRLTDNANAQPMNHWTALSAIKPVLCGEIHS